MKPLADNFTYVIPQQEPLVHTPEHPFCGLDPLCPCYEDPENIAALQHAIQEGELTPEEATHIVKGRTV